MMKSYQPLESTLSYSRLTQTYWKTCGIKSCAILNWKVQQLALFSERSTTNTTSTTSSKIIFLKL